MEPFKRLRGKASSWGILSNYLFTLKQVKVVGLGGRDDIKFKWNEKELLAAGRHY